MSKSIEKLEKLAEEVAKIRQKYFSEGKIAFLEYAKEFLEENKNDIKAIVWNQYTPYFNDGDPCTFRIGDICYIKNDGEALKYYEENPDSSAYDYEEYSISPYSDGISASCKKNMKLFESVINQNEDLMEHIFEDHVTVHVSLNNKGKVEYDTYEYEHE